ncbi:MAG: redoxin domain-containing protein [Desulfomonilaceae bacterium]|nr:redoxin domain-containing protein [Desulfomonilaceae bacterium]
MSLTEELARRREKSREHIPADQLAVMDRATKDLENSGIVDSSLQEGGIAPDFALPNALGNTVSLSEALARGPVVLSFYRGGW